MDVSADGDARRGWDFFISYTQADRAWAEWIAWVLEEDGHRVLIQAWDFVPGSNWIRSMEAGIRDASRMIAVLSDAYLKSVYGSSEWLAAVAADPDGTSRKLLVIRVAECTRPGLLGGVVGVDLFGLAESKARDRLRHMVKAAATGRAKPSQAPAFPGAIGRVALSEPAFPGEPAAFPDGPTADSGQSVVQRVPPRLPSGVIRKISSPKGTRWEALWSTSVVQQVAFSPDGKMLAAAAGKTIYLWSPSMGTLLQVLTGHTREVRSVAFSPDGTLLASASLDKTVRLWEPGKALAHVGTLTDHVDKVLSVAFSPDGSMLASGGYDKRVRLWEPASGAPLHSLTGPTDWIRSVAFSADGALLAAAGDDHRVYLWKTTAWAETRIFTGHRGWIHSIAFSLDESVLASASSDSSIGLWDLAAGTPPDNAFRPWGPAPRTPFHGLAGHTGTVHSLAFSPDGSLLASGGSDNRVRLWETAAWTEIRTLSGHRGGVNSVAFSPDGTLLASAAGRSINLWASARLPDSPGLGGLGSAGGDQGAV